jgi:hypothetical protein
MYCLKCVKVQSFKAIFCRLVLWYLLFVMEEEQVANNVTVEIVRCTLGPAGPLAVNSTSKEYPI